MNRSPVKILLFTVLFMIIGNSLSAEGLLPIWVNGKWGFIDNTGKIIVAPMYDFAFPSSDGMNMVKEGAKFGYVNIEGKAIISPKFTEAYPFTGGIARIKMKDFYAYINKVGQIIASADFEEAYDLIDGLARVKLNGKYGYINSFGEVAIQPKFANAGDFHQGYAMVKFAKTVTNKSVFYFDQSFFDESLYSVYPAKNLVQDMMLNGYIGKSGEVKIPFRYKDARDFSEGLAAVITTNAGGYGKWGYINLKGEMVIAPQFDTALDFHEGLAAVRVGSKWGYIDRNGKYVITPQFGFADDFQEGFARINIGGRITMAGKCFSGKWGFVDKSGDMICPVIFDWVSRFEGGLARIELNGQMGVMNKDGKYKVNEKVEYIFPVFDGLARVKSAGKFGYLTDTGALKLKVQYLQAADFNDGLALVLLKTNQNFTLAYIDKTGTSKWQTGANLKYPFEPGSVLNVLCPTGLWLYDLPSMDSKKIVNIPYGESVTMKKKSQKKELLRSHGLIGGWLFVQFRTVEGYIFEGYLSKLPAPIYGMGLENYFTEKLGLIYQTEPERIDDENEDYYKGFNLGVELHKEVFGGKKVYNYTIPGISMQEAFVLVKHCMGYSFMAMPDYEAVESKQVSDTQVDTCAVKVYRNSPTDITRIDMVITTRGAEISIKILPSGDKVTITMEQI
ncbi:MAG: hypothetical protein A2014_04025 [Spirochaetes bacterium GWF1_49_6]|nr:MAG: hypothetical protein A2014_04025 [Spirochaetes bacterium GWF1_49_6]